MENTTQMLFSLKVKDHRDWDCFSDFMIAGSSIPEALERMYRYISPNEEDIPYYLRSSNIEIKCIGTVYITDKDYENGVINAGYVEG